MNITIKKITVDANGREIVLSFIDGEVAFDGDVKALYSLSPNEMKTLKEIGSDLFLREFGDTI